MPRPWRWNTTPAITTRPMDKLSQIADLAGFEARLADSKARGQAARAGRNCYIEACGIAPSHLVGQLGARAGLFENATVRVNATGGVVVTPPPPPFDRLAFHCQWA